MSAWRSSLLSEVAVALSAMPGSTTAHAKEYRVWFRGWRDRLGLSQVQLSVAADVGRGVISGIENAGPGAVMDITRWKIEGKLRDLAAASGLAWQPPPTEGLGGSTQGGVGERVELGGRIPVIGTVPGGPSALRFQWSEASAGDGFDTVDRGDLPSNRDYFAVRVDGESMAPAFRNGDLCICTPLPRYEDVDPKRLDGKVVVVQFTEESDYKGETTLARWRMLGSQVILTKDNPEYGPMEYPDGGVHHVALVVERRTRVDF